MKSSVKLTLVILASILLIIIAGYLWQTGFLTRRGGPPEKLTIGTNLNAMIGLLFIAVERGYDKAQHLEVVIKDYQTGREPLRELQAGRLDLASCAEFALVDEILAGGADLRCLAAISAGDVDLLIARRDQGVTRPEDLRGKTIGVPLNTSAHFFLGRFLILNRISLQEVTVVGVKPFDLAAALAAGKVDAVLIWEPLTHEIIRKIGPEAISWPAQGGQDVYRLLVTRDEVTRKRPAALEKLMRALVQAQDFFRKHPDDGLEIIARRLKVPKNELGKSPKKYEIFLDQSLLLAMEDEARWMIANRLTAKTQIPNYLDYLDAGPLMKVAPRAVDLVLPGKGAIK